MRAPVFLVVVLVISVACALLIGFEAGLLIPARPTAQAGIAAPARTEAAPGETAGPRVEAQPAETAAAIEIGGGWTLKRDLDPAVLLGGILGFIPTTILAIFAWVQHNDAERAKSDALLPVVESFPRASGTEIDIRNIGNSVAEGLAITGFVKKKGQQREILVEPTDLGALAVNDAFTFEVNFKLLEAPTLNVESVEFQFAYANAYDKKFMRKTRMTWDGTNWAIGV
jgi:hypothetical protein